MVLAVKVKLKDAEKARKELVKNNNYNFNYRVKKVGDFIYFPIKSKEGTKRETADIKLEGKDKKENHSLLLEKLLTKNELEILPRAYEIIGDILILELPGELKKKEKKIAEIFLKTHSNIKTVVKKTEIHSGVYRTRKVEVLAGENKKETTYRESGLRFKVHLEKMYFTSRLTGERLRIAKQIKKDEDVLVMFSGAGPYALVISKHSKTAKVFGVEINPDAHKYAVENAKLNKLKNVTSINGDVKDILPKFYQNILGLKSAAGGMETRLKYNPKIMEIHTFESDFGKGYGKLKKTIEMLLAKRIRVWVHQPIKQGFDVVNNSSANPIYKKMIDLVEKYGINLIIHVSDDAISEGNALENIKSFSKYYNNIYFENALKHYFTKSSEFLWAISKTGITNFCIDISHLLYSSRISEIVSLIKEVQKLCKTYFHLADYKENHEKSDAYPLSASSDKMLEKVLPLINEGIVEVKSKDEKNGKEMINSYMYLKNLRKALTA